MCKKFVIEGRVQGVFFRASTRDKALSLKLCGHAINLPDGSVEVVACGSENGVSGLCEWLHRGPPMAAVTSVNTTEITCARPSGFVTG